MDRRFRRGQALNELRMFNCENQNRIRAIRVSNEVRSFYLKFSEQSRQIVSLNNRAVIHRIPSALVREVVPATVRDYAEVFGERRDLIIPGTVVVKCPMHKHDGLTLATLNVVQLNAIDYHLRWTRRALSELVLPYRAR